MKLLSGAILGMVLGIGWLMSPWHYGYDGFMGYDPHFGLAVVRWNDSHKRTWARLCIGTLENCRLMHKPGDGYLPRVTACSDGRGHYRFCKEKR